MNWVRMRPLLSAWPGGASPPTFEIMADENGDAVIELAFDPQALLAPASYTEPLRYYSTDTTFNASVTDADGSSQNINVPAQQIRLTGNRATWTMPQALWDGYVQESLKLVGSSAATGFRNSIYYRVRVTAVGSNTSEVWPPDSVIQGNREAPHLCVLPMSASPSGQVVPDSAAVQAMGGIPGLPNLWGDVVTWLWNHLPSSSPDRQALVRIFGHEVFRNEIADVNIRGMILKLWLFGGKARRRLPELLDRRVQIGSNLTEPAIIHGDVKTGKSLVENLLGILAITPHPDIVGSPTGPELVGDVIREILDPNGQVNQGAAQTCSPTSMQTMLINVNPSEYARLQIDLLSATGNVELANGTTVTVPPAIFQVTRYAAAHPAHALPFAVRTNAELAFQATLLKYAQAARFPAYSPTAPPNSPNGVNTVFQAAITTGLASAETDRGLEGLFNVTFTTNYVPLTSQAANQGAQPGIRQSFLQDLDAAQQPLGLAMYWNAPYNSGHMVLALRRESGRVFFKNPQYAGSSPPPGVATGASANNPPRRYEDTSGTMESISEADLLTWIKGYWVPDHAIG